MKICSIPSLAYVSSTQDDTSILVFRALGLISLFTQRIPPHSCSPTEGDWVLDSHFNMPLTYLRAVKVFVASFLFCGLVHVLGHSQVAGYLLLASGCVGMAVTVGSATGYTDVIGRDGRTIPPITR